MKSRAFISITLLTLLCLFAYGQYAKRTLDGLSGIRIEDRNGTPISLVENIIGEFVLPANRTPSSLENRLIDSEDKYFYFHPGINPFAIVRALTSSTGGGSTITQQLAKIVLGNTNRRTVFNKVHESLLALALEVRFRKETILTYYINTAPLGERVAGFGAAAHTYFGKSIDTLTAEEERSLIATLRAPSSQNPRTKSNEHTSERVAEHLGESPDALQKSLRRSSPLRSENAFEILPLINKDEDTRTTIDTALTTTLRSFLNNAISDGYDRGVENGAIVAIKTPENEVLALIGSHAPYSKSSGAAIDMSRTPRAVGSTMKPFIFLESIPLGVRPYSLVADREYKFTTDIGEAFYPKNYDGKYRGLVTVAEALTNSYNAPFIAILEHIGVGNFTKSLKERYHIRTLQDVDSYQYGVALGALELDPLSLAHLYTIFPNNGTLKPLTIARETLVKTNINVATPINVASSSAIALVNSTLSDTIRGVEQFGVNGNTQLIGDTPYAVKTGTSHDYHDSWTVGYTGDYVVLVWLGNARNKPMKQVSGSTGAASLWREAMHALQASKYNEGHTLPMTPKNSTRTFDGDTFPALADDSVSSRTILTKTLPLITSIHDGDTYTVGSAIPLKATSDAAWSVNGIQIKSDFFTPATPGEFRITATLGSKSEETVISVQPRE